MRVLMLGVIVLNLIAGEVLAVRVRIGGIKGRVLSPKSSGGGWSLWNKKGRKPTGQGNYPKQEWEQGPNKAPASQNWNTQDVRPPAYNPNYHGQPPAYTKNQQYPQNVPPPPYSQYPQQGHFSYGYPPGHSQGGFGGQGFGNGFGLGGGLGPGLAYGAGSMFGYKRRGLGIPGLIPIPIPIPIGGGGYGYGSYGGGYRRPHRSSSEVKDGEVTDGDSDDSQERPRILAPHDFELDGVTQLPGDVSIEQWDIVGKETAAKEWKNSGDDYIAEFGD